MERTPLYSDSSESEDTNLDIYNSHRLESIDTETEGTSDGSDQENRFTRLATNNKRGVLPNSQNNYGIVPGTTEDHKDQPQEHISRKGTPTSNSPPFDTKPAKTEPSQRESDTPLAATAHSPEEGDELFSSEYVDKLVASFWSKVDQKIETAVSQYQSNPHASQQSDTENNSQTEETSREHAQDDKKSSMAKSRGGVCVYICFIFQFIKKIFDLCKDKGKQWFSDGIWREDLRELITHRHANFTVVMVAIVDSFLVIANILADFGVVDDRGIEIFFAGFLFINLIIMYVFLLECFLRIIVLRRGLFQDSMEVFDVALIGFYFLVEAISSQGFSNIDSPYPKYLHMIVILRCWRILLVLEQLQEEKEVKLSAMENQTQER
ncbi:uncharacterized protein [Montipora capricornis]|uniref:uncharacterized protein n=1 Tax=Montipora capricornis TaxID=246305 RepID=UPI0035F144C3